jgi:prepilin-type N-terminal cleavage/methylation domain-containing protein
MQKDMKSQESPSVSAAGQPSGRTGAFTLIELLVVIIIIALLAALLLPTLAKAKQKGQNIKCLNNLNQLTIAWISYTGDNADKIAQNVASDSGHYSQTGEESWALPGQTWASWVLGDATYPPLALLTNGLIYPYMGNWLSYKCPADVKLNNTNGPTLRSYSMNGWMDGIPVWDNAITPPPAPQMVNFTKLAGIVVLSTANAMVFIEENPASINDGYWIENLDTPTMWVDDPAVYHINSGALSFADGHAQIRKWTDSHILAGEWNSYMGFACDPTSGDLAWVQAHVTVLR